MATNYKIFDENKTNMLSDADYAANTQRQSGVQGGIASSELQNKFQFQTSLMLTALATLFDQNGVSLLDSDTLANFTIKLGNVILQKVNDKATNNEAVLGSDVNKWLSPSAASAAFPSINIKAAPSNNANNIVRFGIFVCTSGGPTSGTWYVLHLPMGPANANTYSTQFAMNQSGIICRRYKVNNSWKAWEYINPPMAVGTEYRTIERFLSKPVYVKMIDFSGQTDNADGYFLVNNAIPTACNAIDVKISYDGPLYTNSTAVVNNSSFTGVLNSEGMNSLIDFAGGIRTVRESSSGYTAGARVAKVLCKNLSVNWSGGDKWKIDPSKIRFVVKYYKATD